MKIILNAVAALPTEQPDTPPFVDGDTLSYRDYTYDLGPIPDGGEVQAESPFSKSIKRVNGQIELTLDYKYSSALAKSSQPSSIDHYTFILNVGQCGDPILYKSSNYQEVTND